MKPLLAVALQFVAGHWRLILAGTLQQSFGFAQIRPAGSTSEIVVRAQSRELLRHCNIDQLIQRNTLRCGNTPGFFEQ